ncbi:MAG: carboxypeptidase-like regulatory domain-containing protein [Saprospiraceae bacterium]|nr:carboxypeptidase-like regulatory domain-containing protein [Saprospiraceae bacterium]
MNRYLPLFLLFLLAGKTASGQGIRGQVKDQNGEPLPYATVFVTKVQLGTATNAEGRYELEVDPGTYEVRFQYLGYTTRVVNIRLGTAWQDIDVQLDEEPVELQTVEILDNREDPAYTIMRRAIGKASYHAQQLDSYTATSYIKGTGRLKDLPGLFRKRIEKALEEEGIDTSTAFVTESVSEISYKRPNQFKEKVISVRTIGEDNNTSPNQFINSSFYNPDLAGAISPLSPKAFAYYRFEYLGFFPDQGFNVNKIKVTPRSAGDNVFEGTIYIVDHIWSIHSLDLSTSIWGINFNINQVYQPIEENVWLPVNHIFDVTGSFFGFDFEYRYFANIQNYQITLNPDLPTEFEVIDEKIEKERAKEADAAISKRDNSTSMQALSSGKEISRKELRKILREYEKQEMKEEMAEIKDTTEVEVVQLTEYSIDSNAYKRDSNYWETIRPIPLTDYEVKGYTKMDSISKADAEEARQRDTVEMTIGSEGMTIKRNKNRGFSPEDIILGGNYRSGKSIRLGWNSPLTNLHFNTVEGYHFAFPFYIHNISKTFRWRINPKLHYSFARNRINGSLNATFNTGEKNKTSNFQIEAGRMTFAYNPSAIDPYISDFASLFWERNYLKVYEQTYFKTSWRKDLDEKNTLRTEILIAERRGLMNNTDHSIFDSDKRAYTSNFPDNAELGSTAFDTSGISQLKIQWETEPWLKYRMRNNRLERIPDSSPKLTFSYRTAVSGVVDNSAKFHHFDFEFAHQWPVGIRGDLSAKINLGTFVNPKDLIITDLHHFRGNRTILSAVDPAQNFRLLDYYQYSSQSTYLAMYTNYQFRKLLITRLPMARAFGWKEVMFVNLLSTEGAKPYVEIGYGLNYIFRVFRIEGVANFLDGKYQDWGIRVGIASNLESLFN